MIISTGRILLLLLKKQNKKTNEPQTVNTVQNIPAPHTQPRKSTQETNITTYFIHH